MNRSITWSVLKNIRRVVWTSQRLKSRKTRPTGGHIPVLADEVIETMDPQNDRLYVDMTFGLGGHTKKILEIAPSARVVCLDQDPTAYQTALSLSQQNSPGQVIPCHGRFSDVPELLIANGIEVGTVDAFLFDIGVSSVQLDQADRGFSHSKDGVLDMRMDQGSLKRMSAMDVVNNLGERELSDIFKKYGEEKSCKKIARAVVETRQVFGKITQTKQLADIVESCFVGKFNQDKINRKSHVATKTFQALRIFVNNELNELNNGLVAAYHFLKPGGKCIVISFHSLEDRIVKRHFHGIDMDEKFNLSLRQKYRMKNDMVYHDPETVDSLLNDKKWTPLSKKVKEASFSEIYENPRARSSKLRAAIKT